MFWSADGGRSLLVSTRDDETKQMGFYGVDLASGSITKLIEEDKSYGVTPFLRDISADGQTIAYVAAKADVSPDIWISDSNFRRPRQVTKTSPQFEQYEFGKSRLVEWRSIDGIRLRGTLLLPAGYKEGQRYPMIVFPYPNDRRSDFVNRFGVLRAATDNMQLFATRGYVVLLPDNVIREGSTLRDLGKSIMPGVDKIVEMGIADGSARGQMLYDAGAGVHGMGGTPWEVRHRYIENSPLFYLDSVETPLLIIHGGSESNVAAHHADEIFVDMRRLGKKVVYARYAGEDHSEDLWGYPNQLDYLNRVIGWYDTYLKAPSAASKN